MRLVIALDSFKGTLAATAAGDALAAGWREVRPDDEVVTLPQADGGEGTLDAIAAALPDAERRIAHAVTGPDGRPVDAAWLWMPDGHAVAELAASSGLPLLTAPDPLGATTRGLGEVVAAALDAGATAVTIALGGSASTDGGVGALAALGARFLDADGREVTRAADLGRLHRVDLGAVRPAPPGGIVLLTDVTAPLFGPSGAAAVFGPQKGASTADVAVLDAALRRLAAVVADVPGRGGVADPATPGAGAAGGTAFGFRAVWGGVVRPGAAMIADLTGLNDALQRADFVLTGEGRFDHTSGSGKVVGEVLDRAEAAHVPAGIVAGSIGAPAPVPAWSLTDLAGSTTEAIADPTRWLREAGRRVATELPRRDAP